jgi:hypothetical protein
MTDLSPTDTLRAAADRLTLPGAPILVAPRLVKPLAKLLEHTAQFASLYADLSRASGVEPTEKDHDKTVRAALAVARAILADAPPDGPTPPQTAADTPGASSDTPTAPTPPQAHTADPGTGLSVQLDDALWDAIAVPGPKEPTFVQQHQRVCRVVAEHLQALATAQDEDMRGRTVYTCPGETVPAELRERLTQAIDKARIWHATDGTGTWGYTQTPAITNAVLTALDHEMQQIRQRAEQAEAAIVRVLDIPRLPHHSQQTGELGRAYTRGWESVISAIDAAFDEPVSDPLPVTACRRTDRHGYHMWGQQDDTPAFCPGYPAHVIGPANDLAQPQDGPAEAAAEGRPRCPHCQLPHDLEPDSTAVAACRSIRVSLAAPDAPTQPTPTPEQQ